MNFKYLEQFNYFLKKNFLLISYVIYFLFLGNKLINFPFPDFNLDYNLDEGGFYEKASIATVNYINELFVSLLSGMKF